MAHKIARNLCNFKHFLAYIGAIFYNIGNIFKQKCNYDIIYENNN